MSTHKWIDRICMIVLLLSLAVTVLFMNGERFGITVIVDEDAETYEDSVWFTQNDLKAEWDTSEATVIALNGDAAQIAGNGAYWLDGNLVIAQSGQYVISGELTDGSIVVDAEDYSKVWILLNGMTVACSDDACLRVNQADKVFLTLAEGTENVLTGTEYYSEEAQADGTNAVIYSHDDLTINGSGSLSVTAACLNGITSKDDLIITGGTITITAPGHGIKVNDRFRFTAADLTITVEQDGIHSDLEFLMESGSITISAQDDGVHADSLVQIYGGSLQITDCYEGIEAVVIEQYGGDITIDTRDDGLNANGYTGYDFGGGMKQQTEESQTTEQTTVTADETYILIAGGTLTITNSSGMDADGIDSNGNILVTGGTIRIFMANNNGNSPLDCGTEAGGQALISGGIVIACGNYSMAESFESASSQCSILYNISEGITAGAIVSLLKTDNSMLLSEEIPYGFSSVILSSPELTIGENYRIIIGDSEEEITLGETSASYGDASSQMFTGTMNWGGMQPMQMDGKGTPPPLPEGEAGMAPPAFAEGDMSGTLPSPPDGEAPAEGFAPPAGGESTMATGTDLGSDTNGFPTQGMGFPEKGTMSQERFAGLAQENAQTEKVADEVAAGTTTSTEAWLLVAISALILIVGVILALCYRRSLHINT